MLAARLKAADDITQAKLAQVSRRDFPPYVSSLQCSIATPLGFICTRFDFNVLAIKLVRFAIENEPGTP